MSSNKRRVSWEEYEKGIQAKKKGNKNTVKAKNTPECIQVQRMSTEPNSKKRYEVLDIREFVDFSEYHELTIENVQKACEKHFGAPTGSCDVLLSDKGPSCFATSQVVGKKVFFVRFINPVAGKKVKTPLPPFRVHSSPVKSKPSSSSITPLSICPKSISIADLLNARKLIKPRESVEGMLILESFNIERKMWERRTPTKFFVETEKFAEGGFREAFKADGCGEKWVLKKYKPLQAESIMDTLSISIEDHTRKQVQMHAVARSLAGKFSRDAPIEFGDFFTYNSVYFAKYQGNAVTMEKYVKGENVKYVSNDGTLLESGLYTEFIEKAESFCHFTYHISGGDLMVVDIQGLGYTLYDPEIASSETPR